MVKYYKLFFLLLLVAALIVYSRQNQPTLTTEIFTGKWQSSKLATPIHLYANGEWEIKTDIGVILQYGVWEFKNKKIIWSFKAGSYIKHDANTVLSVSPQEFTLLEENNSTTIFRKLN